MPGRAQRCPPPRIGPATEVGREHGEVIATRRQQFTRLHDRQRRAVYPQCASVTGQACTQPPLSLAAVGADVGGDVHDGRVGRRRHLRHLFGDVTGAHDETPADLA